MTGLAPCVCKHGRGEHKHTARAGVVAACLHRGCRCRGFELDELAALGAPEPPPGAAKAPGGVVMCTSSEVDELAALGAAQLSHEPGPQVLTLPEVLAIWDSLLCQACGSRFFDERECCGSPLLEVTVIMTRRLNLQLSTLEGIAS